MTDDNRQFTTDSSPGEQTFESTVADAAEFIKADPFGRDLPPHIITIGQSRSTRTHSTTQDDSSTGGDK